METSTGNLNPLDYKKSFYWPVMITDTSTDTLCPPEVERLVTTVSVTSETTNSNSLLPNTALFT
jgi:hypothetical protein